MEETIMMNSSRLFRLLCLMMALSLAPFSAIAQDADVGAADPCDHTRYSYSLIYETKYPTTALQHIVEKYGYDYCEDCQYFKPAELEMYLEFHTFNADGTCTGCGYNDNSGHICADADCSRCTIDIKSVEKYSSSSHYAYLVVTHKCTECGHSIQVEDQYHYMPHYYEDVPDPTDRGTVVNNKDGRTHTHTYTVNHTCVDCGYVSGQSQATDPAQGHQFSVTTTLRSDETGHWKYKTRKCRCGFNGYVTDEKEQGKVSPHAFKDGVCTECSYTCQHAYENDQCALCGMQKMMTYSLRSSLEGQLQPDGTLLCLLEENQQVEIFLYCKETDSNHSLAEFMQYTVASPDQSMNYIPGRYEHGKASLREGQAQGSLTLVDKRTQEVIDTLYFALKSAPNP